jgi:pyridoxal phosphate enzyme (YggS family)
LTKSLNNNLSNELRANFDHIQASVNRAAAACGRSPEEVRIIAVSKTQSNEVVQAALDAGITTFGENYAQEIKDKGAYFLNAPIAPEWHYIGHLQTNKVKMIAPYVACVQSVDSERLAKELNKAASQLGRTINVLLQVNTSQEESKSGCEPHEIGTLTESVLKCSNLRIRGLMTIAAIADDQETVRPMFRLLRTLRDELRTQFPTTSFDELSMGMSSDFEAAIQEGATMIRIGTAIFGARQYKTATV